MKKTNTKEFSNYIKENFSLVSRRYDILNHILSFGMDIIWRKTASKMIDRNKSGLILDLCAGTCDLAFSVLNQSPNQKVIGVDFSHEMLLLGKQKADSKKKQIGLVRSDVMKLPFPDEIADGILIAFGLRNLCELRSGLSEMHRVLKKGGSLIILEFSKVKTPILKQIYDFYFRYLLPFIGMIISGNGKFYKYLHDSVQDFPDKNEIIAIALETGFSVAEIKELTFGIASVYHFKREL